MKYPHVLEHIKHAWQVNTDSYRVRLADAIRPHHMSPRPASSIPVSTAAAAEAAANAKARDMAKAKALKPYRLSDTLRVDLMGMRDDNYNFVGWVTTHSVYVGPSREKISVSTKQDSCPTNEDMLKIAHRDISRLILAMRAKKFTHADLRPIGPKILNEPDRQWLMPFPPDEDI